MANVMSQKEMKRSREVMAAAQSDWNRGKIEKLREYINGLSARDFSRLIAEAFVIYETYRGSDNMLDFLRSGEFDYRMSDNDKATLYR